MQLTAEDYDPRFLDRPYAHIDGDPYPPPSKEKRAVLACLPKAGVAPTDRERFADDIVSALHELDVDPVKFGALVEPESTEYVSVPTPGDAAAAATFDADHQYEYEFEGDTATIELAAQSETALHEPQVGWRVTAGAGTVSGTNGWLDSLNGNGFVEFLDVGEAVHWGDDTECPIIAGARFEKLPVPGLIAHELNDRLNEMGTLTSPDADAALGNDPTAFPATISDPTISENHFQEPFAWDADRLIMWYDNTDSNFFEPSPYQIEDGMVIARWDDPQYLDRDLPDSREEFIEVDGLECISCDDLTASSRV